MVGNSIINIRFEVLRQSSSTKKRSEWYISKFVIVYGCLKTIFLGRQCKVFLKLLANKDHDYTDPAWFNHFVKVAKLINAMMTSSFGNELDITPVEKTQNGQSISVAKWDSDMQAVMKFMQHGWNEFGIQISPLSHTLIHVYHMLKKNPSQGFGNYLKMI